MRMGRNSEDVIDERGEAGGGREMRAREWFVIHSDGKPAASAASRV